MTLLPSCLTVTCLTDLLAGLTAVAQRLASETGAGHRDPVRRALMLDGMTVDLAQGCLWCMSLARTGMTTGTGMAGTGLTGHGLTRTGLSRTRLIGTTAKAGRSMAEATALSGHGMTTIGGLGRRV